MQRRVFLHATLAAAGSAWLEGCSSADTSASSTPSRFEGRALEDSAAHFPQSLASGDPRPSSVVLWTRVADAKLDDARLSVWLQLARDPAFDELIALDGAPELELDAELRFDRCVKARVTELDSETIYYYRFVYETGARAVTTRTGRFKTAPAAERDVAVRFAVMSCQDYQGRYYHSLARAAQQELDFFLHLGDYVYETAAASDDSGDGEAAGDGDGDGERRIRFGDPSAALRLGERYFSAGDATSSEFLAAQSLDNYRDLYRTVRGDPQLQRLHESAAMIAIPDDHEFSNDAHGQTATYFNGQRDERNPERRKNADQAWFEYMPVDYPGEPNFVFDRDAPFPDDLRVYRDFRFGKHVHIVMTDLRRYRADHVIPEGVLPASIAVDATALEQLMADLTSSEPPSFAAPYLIVADHDASLGELLASVLDQAEAEAVDWSQPLDASYVNALIERYNQANEQDQLTAFEVAELPRGIPYSAALVQTESSSGARYFLGLPAFTLIAQYRYAATDRESEQVMGRQQERWFVDTLKGSDATWKIWGNEYTLLRKQLDISAIPDVPEAFAQPLLVSADDWDGMPNRRRDLLARLDGVENLIVVTGDIHSFFAGHVDVDPRPKLIEFVCGAVSSATLQSTLESGEYDLGDFSSLARFAGALLEASNPHVVYNHLAANGFATLEVDADALQVTFHLLDYLLVERPDPDPLTFAQQRFRVRAGRDTIEMLEDTPDD